MVTRYKIGPLEVLPHQQVILSGTEVVALAPKTVGLLLILLENAGQVVGRHTLRDRLWGDSFVEEAVISRNVSLLRSGLRPYLGDGGVIETLSKRGYRFTGEVVVETEPIDADASTVGQTDILPGAPDGSTPRGDVVETLSPPLVSAQQASAKSDRFSPRRVAAAGIALAVALAAGLIAHRRGVRVATQSQPTVAVLTFRDLSDEPDTRWVGVALQESLAAELSRDRGAVVASAQRAETAERELGLDDSRTPTVPELQDLGKRLASDLVLNGSFLAHGGQVRVDMMLYRAKGGTVVSQFSETVPQTDLQDAIVHARAALRTSLRLPVVQASLELPFLTQDQLSGQMYAEGLRLLRTGDAPEQAQQKLSEAVLASPQSPQAHAALSEAWTRLGYSDRAAVEARLTLDTCAQLPAREKLPMQAAAYLQLQNYPMAIEALQQLTQLEPENPEYKLQLGSALTNANRLDAAWTLLRPLSDPASPLAADARVPLLLSDISSRRGDAKAILIYAGQAIQLAQADGSHKAEADALVKSGQAWSSLANYDRCIFDLEKAEQLYLRVGDRTGAVGAVLAQAAAMQSFDKPMMESTARRALADAQQIGAQDLIALALFDVANIQLTHDREADAAGTYQQIIAIAETIHDANLKQRALSDLGTAEIGLYEMSAAREHTQQALTLARANQSSSWIDRNIVQLSEIDQYLGLLDQAETGFRESVRDYGRLGQTMHKNDELFEVGEVLLMRGKLQEAEAVFKSIDMHSMSLGNVSLLKTEMARLTAEQGNPALAEAEAAASAASANSANYSMGALELLTELQLRRGALADARATVAKMSTLQKSIPTDKDAEMTLAYEQALVEMQTGNVPAAEKALHSLLTEARRLGDKALELQVRCAQAYGEKMAGHGNRALQIVENDALQSGFVLIAGNAAREIAT